MEHPWALLYPHPVSKAGGTGFYRFPVLDLTEAERCQVRSRHLLAFPDVPLCHSGHTEGSGGYPRFGSEA